MPKTKETPTETPTETVKRETIKIENVDYFVDSITDEGKKLIESINVISGKAEEAKVAADESRIQLEIVNIARDSLVEKLIIKASEFEKVPTA